MRSAHVHAAWSLAASLAFGTAWAGAAVPGGPSPAVSGDEPAATRQPAPSPAASPADRPFPVIPFFLPRMAPANTDQAIQQYQERIKYHPDDQTAFAGLAGAFLGKARESNDPIYYTRSEKTLDQLARLDPDNYAALSIRAQLDCARHQFPPAIVLTEKAIQINPNDPINYGNLGDIYAELGDYDKAEVNYAKMMEMKPGRAAYSRASYMKELYGEDLNARKLMKMAIDAGAPTGEGAAWCHAYLGNLYFSAGFLDAAEREYNAGLAAFPGFFHALTGLAAVKAARKDYPEAINLYLRSLQSGPYHETLGALIELYTLTGQKAAAQSIRDRLAALQERYAANGMDIDFEVAEIDAEHGINLPHALALAKDEVKTHANIKAYDGLAWIAYLNGDLKLAQSAIEQAVRLGTHNALTYYHAAKIQEAVGNKQLAIYWFNQALTRCPYFHVRYADDARASVDRLSRSLVSAAAGTAAAGTPSAHAAAARP